MENVKKEKAFYELYQLINFYYENRDQPNSEFDFFKEVEKYCNILEMDFSEFKQQFNLKQNSL